MGEGKEGGRERERRVGGGSSGKEGEGVSGRRGRRKQASTIATHSGSGEEGGQRAASRGRNGVGWRKGLLREEVRSAQVRGALELVQDHPPGARDVR